MLEQLPCAIERADRSLAARRSAVTAFVDGELSEHVRLPPMPPESSASWTMLPLYPTGPVTSALLRAIRESLGAIELSPRVPPSRLSIFRNCEKRVVPGTARTDPLLVTIDDRRGTPAADVGEAGNRPPL